jgi:flagellar export protein FliJ
MKAFTFRLEQVLRWREMQVGLQQARAAEAAGHASQLRSSVDAQKAEAVAGAAQIAREATGVALASYARFVEASRARIQEAEARAAKAQRALALERDRLVEANRRLRLLEDLRKAGLGRWRKEHDRELTAFADEAFLGRIKSKMPSANRTEGMRPREG